VFTGLVAEVAAIERVASFAGGRRFHVSASCARDLQRGESVALNGVCLTVEREGVAAGSFAASAVEESLQRTTAGRWRERSRVHLERALAVGDRFGGHIVQGHVDGVARVMRCGRAGRSFVLAVQLPPELRRYVVAKGSLAIDGVSLTVASLKETILQVAIIPETLERTLIGSYRPGDVVNIEVDVVGKYVETLLKGR